MGREEPSIPSHPTSLLPPPRLLPDLLACQDKGGASKLNIASRNAPTTQKWDRPGALACLRGLPGLT